MAEHVRRRLVDLAVAENYLSDGDLSDAFSKLWAEGTVEDALVGDLWVEGTYPGEKTKDSLKSLADAGLFPPDLCAHIKERQCFPTDRLLYNHQSEAIRTAVEKRKPHLPALVITAGTGLGKTEAFLLPALQEMWNDPNRREGGGMRCLILYPMNALVADQVDRVYRWLQGQSRLTLFHFTSETPEDHRAANRRGEELWDPCRKRTRQEARGKETHDGRTITNPPFGQVPDIVITNYSMLEYMLCRPQDACFFGPDLRCIVIDEAHLYTGALAAEITMLLRRVRSRCGVSSRHILQIATSATLGGTDVDLKKYSSALFSVSEESALIIRGRHEKPSPMPIGSVTGSSHQASMLAEHSDMPLSTITTMGDLVSDGEATVKKLTTILRDITPRDVIAKAGERFPGTPARFLRHALEKTPLIYNMAHILSSRAGQVLSLDSLAQSLFQDSTTDRSNEKKATTLLLRLSAAARHSAEEMPLIPHRLHFLVRAPERLSMCLNPACTGPQQYHGLSLGAVQSLSDKCRHCGHVTLPIHRCDSCGEWAFAGHKNEENGTLEPGYYSEKASERIFFLIASPRGQSLPELVIDPVNGTMHGHGAIGISLWEAPRVSMQPAIQQCPTCNTEWTPASEVDYNLERKQSCRPIVGGRPFALSVVAETVLHDLPPLEDVTSHWKPAGGRRLLCFSDSRSGAARLGPLLTRQHEISVVRSAIARCASGLRTAEVASDLEHEITDLEDKLRDLKLSYERQQRFTEELERKRKELEKARAGVPFPNFCTYVAQRPEIKEVLHRDSAERHQVKSYDQQKWEDNNKATIEHIEGLVASEFDRPLRTSVSLEAVGLIEIAYPGISHLGMPPQLESELPTKSRKELNKSWSEILSLLLDSLRADHCMGWSEETENRKWLGQSPLDGKWATRAKGGWDARAFVGATTRQQRRKFARQVLLAAGCPDKNLDKLSEMLLQAAFDQLYAGAETKYDWLRRKEHHQTGPDAADRAILILLDRLAVRRPEKLYRCAQTGTIWTHSALGWTWMDGCRGNLQPISSQELDQDRRWERARRELAHSQIFEMGLWAEEHSAQLSPQVNRRLQDLFKEGIRNVLSSTTTMELGVDIGGLNAVLLGNVPPGPANHRQRAGRAGRRSDGSAVVLSYSRGSAFDREVFRNFGKFITQELRRPVVFMDRRKIIERHLRAVLFSEFFRGHQPEQTGAMQAFGRMGAFCGEGYPQYWKTGTKPVWNPNTPGMADQFLAHLDGLTTGKDPVQENIASLCQGTSLFEITSEEKWATFVDETRKSFSKAIGSWREDIRQLRQGWDEVPANPSSQASHERAKANSIKWQVQALCDITVIEWLADHRFLPRYGFPINLQNLKVRSQATDQHGYTQPRGDERYRLERSSLLALSEYVPGSRVLVGGKVAISRGINKHWTESNYDQALGLQRMALECPGGHVYTSLSPQEVCPQCGCSPIRVQQLIFPRFGYTTAAWEPPKRETTFERVGEGKVYPLTFTGGQGGEIKDEFVGIRGLRLNYREEAELLIRNAGDNKCGFAICTRCGFAESEESYGDGVMKLPADFARHASVFSPKADSFCWTKNEANPPILRNRVIAAREFTDMVLIEWPGATNQKAAFSLGRALVLAGTRLLELDARELNMELLPLQYPNLGIVIFDSTPGGAGHCLELVRLGREWIEKARDILFVDSEHDQRCQRACLDCIIDFSGQHRANMLDRRAALQLLDGATQLL